MGQRGAAAGAGAETVQSTVELGCRRRPAEGSQIQFLDQIVVRFGAENRFRYAAAAIGDSVGNSFAIDEIQRLGKTKIAAAFTLTRRFARWPPEQIQEA